MSEPRSVHVLRRSPGRLRVHAPWLSAGRSGDVRWIAASEGVLDVRLTEPTGNVLIEFDPALIDEPELVALIADPPRTRRSQRPRRHGPETVAPASGWLRAERSETIRARPAECVAALIDFEDYPQWQAYVTFVSVLERDPRGRGVRVATQASVGERKIHFVTSYHFPSPNRIAFEQADGELEAVRGSWAFRSLGGGRTRATLRLEVKPGWRLGLMLRGSLYEQLREAVLDHLMRELRERVEST